MPGAAARSAVEIQNTAGRATSSICSGEMEFMLVISLSSYLDCVHSSKMRPFAFPYKKLPLHKIENSYMPLVPGEREMQAVKTLHRE